MARKPADQSVNPEDIILAAADVLHRNGYEATTMKDIAAEVNLTAASLYHHFKNKDALLLAVLEAGLEFVTDRLEPIVNADCSPREKLSEMIRVHVLSVTQNTTVGAAMVFEIRALLGMKTPRQDVMDDNTLTDRLDQFFGRRDYFESLFSNVIKQGIESGAFREVDASIYTKMMLGAHNWVGVWYREGGRLNGETIAYMMADYLLRGLVD